jgi:hypothetical protein
MIQAGLPSRFWYLACSTAVFLTNRTITKAVSEFRTPFEIWHFRKPSIHHLRVFGCQAFRLIRKELRESKFSPVSSEGVLVGFEQDNFNYLIYDLAENKCFISHHATFNESVYPFRQKNLSIESSKDIVRSTFFEEDDEGEQITELVDKAQVSDDYRDQEAVELPLADSEQIT